MHCPGGYRGRGLGWCHAWVGPARAFMPARRRRALRSKRDGSGRQRFLAALDWAEQKQLIGVGEIEGVTYLWLVRPKAEEEELD